MSNQRENLENRCRALCAEAGRLLPEMEEANTRIEFETNRLQDHETREGQQFVTSIEDLR